MSLAIIVDTQFSFCCQCFQRWLAGINYPSEAYGTGVADTDQELFLVTLTPHRCHWTPVRRQDNQKFSWLAGGLVRLAGCCTYHQLNWDSQHQPVTERLEYLQEFSEQGLNQKQLWKSVNLSSRDTIPLRKFFGAEGCLLENVLTHM